MKEHIELVKIVQHWMDIHNINYKKVLAEADISAPTWYALTDETKGVPNLLTLQKVCQSVGLTLVLSVETDAERCEELGIDKVANDPYDLEGREES